MAGCPAGPSVNSRCSSEPLDTPPPYPALCAQRPARGMAGFKPYPPHTHTKTNAPKPCPVCSEAGEGEDGRMKSAIGIGALLMDGLGDTIRVSLTEDPEFEIDPCNRLATLGQQACSQVCVGGGLCVCMRGPVGVGGGLWV